ncbi:MAG TPA: cyclic nucleotide-binding domain-containing protein [Polyangiaceae bacterium]|jgi:CRP-like cAMP-binding protein|nr:cyclic nucleotide-binding domain-containing protein [Polyangiaceae bacterium]
MADVHLIRLQRELALAEFGLKLEPSEAWVIDRITRLLEERLIADGEILVSPGEPPKYLYFTSSGHVRVSRPGSPTWTLRGRWFIGMFDTLRESASDRSTVAVGSFQAERVLASAWLDLLQDCYALARESAIAACSALERLEARLPIAPRIPSAADAGLTLTTGELSRLASLASLKRVSLFRTAGVQSLADLAEVTREVVFEPGRVVLARGQPWPELLVLLDGEVRVEREAPRAERTFGPLQVICAPTVLAGAPSSWEAIAVRRSRALVIPRAVWFDLLEDHFDLFRALIADLAARREVILDELGAKTGNLELT